MLTTDLMKKNRRRLVKKGSRIIIGLALAWFRKRSIHSYYPYHFIRDEATRLIERETGQEMGSLELHIFDQVLDCLEQLGFAQWCGCATTQSSRYESSLFTFFYVLRPIDLTVEDVLWHFKMNRCVAWLERRIESRKIIPDLHNAMILFKNHLKRCKSPVDYYRYRSNLFQKVEPFKSEAELFIHSMEHVVRL